MATAVQRGGGPATASAAPPEQAVDQAPAAGRAKPRWLMPAVIAAAAIGGAALARLVVVPRMGATAHAAEAAPKAAAPTTLFRLENLVVNPAGSQGTRFLMTSVAVETDAAMTATLNARDVELRDRVTELLAAQPLDLLVSTAARDSVKHLVGGAVAAVLPPGTRIRVYLPQFVIQ